VPGGYFVTGPRALLVTDDPAKPDCDPVTVTVIFLPLWDLTRCKLGVVAPRIVEQDTGKLMWDDKLPSAPFGAAAVTNNVVLTTTFTGHLYAFNATTGAILLDTPLSAATNAAVTIDGDYVIVGSEAALSKSQRVLIVAYRLGANGKLPDTVSE
jgi:hypothetical protein